MNAGPGQREDELAAGVEESAEDLFEDAPCGYLSVLVDGTIVRVNRTFEAWTGHHRGDLLRKRRIDDLLTAGGRIYYETHVRPLLHMQGSVREVALEVACVDERRLPVLVNAALRQGEDGGPAIVRVTVFDASHRRAYEQELLRARRRAERLQRNNAILAEISQVLDVERGVEARVRALLGLPVRELAGGAALQLTGHGEKRAVAGASDEAELAEALQGALSSDAPVRLSGGGGTGYLAVQLAVRGRLLGALAVSTGPDADDHDESVLLEAVADRAAVAIENARLYESEREVAHGLQRAMLPRHLFQDDRCRITAHYAAADDVLEVGGDWYDTFCVSEDRIGLVVGDVVGKGLDAAATMGQLRSALRAHGVSGLGPQAVLEHLDTFVSQTENAEAATVALAAVDLSAGELRVACAGHPPPILVPPEGDPVLIWEGRSAPLGFGRGATRHEVGYRLEPMSRLLLYSDGAVERRDGDIDAGIARLMTSFAERRDEPIEQVVASLSAEEYGADDVCMLACAFDGLAPAR